MYVTFEPHQASYYGVFGSRYLDAAMSPIDEQAIQATEAPAEAHHLTAAVLQPACGTADRLTV